MARFKSLYLLGGLVAIIICPFAAAQIIENQMDNDVIDEGTPPILFTDEEKTQVFLEFAADEMETAAFERDATSHLIKEVQEKFNLPITGVLDDATMQLALSPRCGVARNWVRYYRFRKKNLKWSLFNYSPDLSPCEVRNILRKGFRTWEEVMDVTFEEATDPNDDPEKADIKIRFGYGHHHKWEGPNTSFKGAGGVLAHAYPPYGGRLQGELHFDEAEFWTLNRKRVVVTYKGNSDGSPCVLPFKYNNKLHHECVQTPDKDGLEWCATTDNYDQDQKWGYCPQPELFTFGGNSAGEACAFPFKYNDVIYNSCTNAAGPNGIMSGYSWCSTTYDFSSEKKWGYCPTKVKSKVWEQDLLYTTIHEMGHILGFDHSDSRNSIMYKYIQRSSVLGREDVKEVQRMYGRRTTALPDLVVEKCGGEIDKGTKPSTTTAAPPTTPPTTTSTTTIKTTTTVKPEKKKLLCQVGSFDASVMLAYSTYYFKGSFVFDTSKDATSQKGVKGMKIRDKFEKGPRRVDAAFMKSSDYNILLIKGKKYWQYNYHLGLIKGGKSVKEIGLSNKDTIKATVPINDKLMLIFYDDYYVSYNPETMKQENKKFITPAQFSPPDAAVGGDVLKPENKDVLYFFKNKNAYKAKLVRSGGEMSLKVEEVLQLNSYFKC